MATRKKRVGGNEAHVPLKDSDNNHEGSSTLGEEECMPPEFKKLKRQDSVMTSNNNNGIDNNNNKSNSKNIQSSRGIIQKNVKVNVVKQTAIPSVASSSLTRSSQGKEDNQNKIPIETEVVVRNKYSTAVATTKGENYVAFKKKQSAVTELDDEKEKVKVWVRKHLFSRVKFILSDNELKDTGGE